MQTKQEKKFSNQTKYIESNKEKKASLPQEEKNIKGRYYIIRKPLQMQDKEKADLQTPPKRFH